MISIHLMGVHELISLALLFRDDALDMYFYFASVL